MSLLGIITLSLTARTINKTVEMYVCAGAKII